NESVPNTIVMLHPPPRSTVVPCTTLFRSYQWQRKVGAGSFTDIVGETSSTLDLSLPNNGSKGDQLRVKVTPHDGDDAGLEVTSAAVTVVNTPPVVDSASINESAPKTSDTLHTTVAGHASEGDTVYDTERWQRKVVAGAFTDIVGETPSLHDALPIYNGSKGDQLRVKVTPHDGDDAGLEVTSAAVTVVNTPPVVDSASINESAPKTSDTLHT